MSITVNPFKFQTAKTFDKSKNDRDVHASECPIADTNMHLNTKIVKFGPKVVQSASLLDTCAYIQAKKQTMILFKVKSAKDNITKLFKTNGRVSPATSNLGRFSIPSVQQHCVQDVHPSPPLLTSMSQSAISRVRVVTVFDSPPSGHTRLEANTSLGAYSEHVVAEDVEDFISVSRCVAEAPSPSSPARLLTAPEFPRTLPSTFLPNELHRINEEVGNTDVDAEGAHAEPKKPTVSSSCVPLTTSNSQARYDATLAADFATFSFDSDLIQEWSDEVEREKQARMDAHFAYVSEALAVPFPKLSAYFSTDSPASFTVDKDESLSKPSPVKTETSETNTSSADSSLVTSVDAEENRFQLSPTVLRGLRRVRNHENLRAITDCSDSFSDQSCWSFDLGLSDSPAAGSKTGALRRSVKCNDLRRSFLLESGRCYTPSREIVTSKNRLSSFWRLGDPVLPARAHPQGVHFFM
ncbi:hypothetical protein J3R83DRAFT_12195 [Lanmaoa asiatica]|nr:hypothetical protein J3R83DRAFT_12195 [Lanmaoa asiatica]